MDYSEFFLEISWASVGLVDRSFVHSDLVIYGSYLVDNFWVWFAFKVFDLRFYFAHMLWTLS